MTRQEKLEALKQHFLSELVEDPIDGTTFDIDVLKAIEALQRIYITCKCGHNLNLRSRPYLQVGQRLVRCPMCKSDVDVGFEIDN